MGNRGGRLLCKGTYLNYRSVDEEPKHNNRGRQVEESSPRESREPSHNNQWCQFARSCHVGIRRPAPEPQPLIQRQGKEKFKKMPSRETAVADVGSWGALCVRTQLDGDTPATRASRLPNYGSEMRWALACSSMRPDAMQNPMGSRAPPPASVFPRPSTSASDAPRQSTCDRWRDEDHGGEPSGQSPKEVLFPLLGRCLFSYSLTQASAAQPSAA